MKQGNRGEGVKAKIEIGGYLIEEFNIDYYKITHKESNMIRYVCGGDLETLFDCVFIDSRRDEPNY